MDIEVGDWVKITKSKTNWNIAMDKFIGQIVQVTNVDFYSRGKTINFKNDGDWTWCYEEKHFQLISNQIIEVW